MLNDEVNEHLLSSETPVQLDFRTASEKEPGKVVHRSTKFLVALLLVLVVGSLVLNIVLLWDSIFPVGTHAPAQLQYSRYATMELNKLSIPWIHRTEYWSDNETQNDDLWAAIDIEPGFIVLDKSWAAGKGLPPAADFPWDPSKGFYQLEAYHNLHCLKMLYTSVTESHRNSKQSMSYRHLLHCLDWMRQDTLCSADDTPLFIAPEPDKRTGHGQARQCQGFADLETWAKTHHSCFQLSELDDNSGKRIDKFQHCPPGSPYQEQVQEYQRTHQRNAEDTRRTTA